MRKKLCGDFEEVLAVLSETLHELLVVLLVPFLLDGSRHRMADERLQGASRIVTVTMEHVEGV